MQHSHHSSNQQYMKSCVYDGQFLNPRPQTISYWRGSTALFIELAQIPKTKDHYWPTFQLEPSGIQGLSLNRLVEEVSRLVSRFCVDDYRLYPQGPLIQQSSCSLKVLHDCCWRTCCRVPSWSTLRINTSWDQKKTSMKGDVLLRLDPGLLDDSSFKWCEAYS